MVTGKSMRSKLSNNPSPAIGMQHGNSVIVWKRGKGMRVRKSMVTVVGAQGHGNVRATHRTTLEITKDSHLTKRGDCIVGVNATHGAVDLASSFKEAARRRDARITITIEAGDLNEVIVAHGSPHLLFTHPTDLVVRKSGYICNRTIAINANKAASDLSNQLVETLQDPRQRVQITLAVDVVY